MTSCKWADKCIFSFWQHKNVKVFLWTIVFLAACKRCNNSQQVWDLQCIVGRIQPIGLCNPCVMSVRGPYDVGRTMQTDPTLLGYASAITEQKKCWELLAEKFDRFQTLRNNTQQHATTSNNMQQGVQTDATCNIQQCWELLANNVASVCTGLHLRGESRNFCFLCLC